MPNIHPRFAHFYGYGNFDSLFYFATPSFILMKFNHIPIAKRIFYSFLFMSSYTIFKFLYVKEYNQELRSYIKFIKSNDESKVKLVKES